MGPSRGLRESCALSLSRNPRNSRNPRLIPLLRAGQEFRSERGTIDLRASQVDLINLVRVSRCSPGLASSTTKSASLPVATVPIRVSPRIRAFTDVAA